MAKDRGRSSRSGGRPASRSGGSSEGRGGAGRADSRGGGRSTGRPESRSGPRAESRTGARSESGGGGRPDGRGGPRGAGRGGGRYESRGEGRPEVAVPYNSTVISSTPRPPGSTPSGAKPNSAFMISGRERLSLGIHSVREALKVRPHAIKRFGLRDDFARAPQLKELADLAQEFNVEVMPLSVKELDNIGSGHQGAAAVITESPHFDFNKLKAMEKCVLVACDGLEDPMNLGAVLRSSWLLGASGILLPQDRSVTLTTASAKVASGGAEHVPVEIVTNLPRELELLREAGFWIFGLAEKGTGFPWEFKLPEKIVWVIGSESSGLRVTVERACDELVKLPQVPGGSSFNAAVSASMALYESARQHGFTVES